MADTKPPTEARARAQPVHRGISNQDELELLRQISDKLDYLLLQHEEELEYPHHKHYLETLLTPE